MHQGDVRAQEPDTRDLAYKACPLEVCFKEWPMKLSDEPRVVKLTITIVQLSPWDRSGAEPLIRIGRPGRHGGIAIEDCLRSQGPGLPQARSGNAEVVVAGHRAIDQPIERLVFKALPPEDGDRIVGQTRLAGVGKGGG